MKEIGVVSDTHLLRVEQSFEGLFNSGVFKRIDTFIHAGDFTSIEVVDFLESFVFYGVQGNMDDYSIRKRLPERRVVTIEGIKIGVMHGWGAPFDLGERVYAYFGDASLDCIVFGHSHQPANYYIGKTLMFNPGSLKHSLISPRRTVGKLLIEEGKIRGEILTF